jgi:hypothetical protein
MTAFSRPALSRFLILYAALYAGFGVQSPYLPSLLESRDLRPEAIALVLAAGSAVRLVAGSERLTGALLDRLTHHVHILEMNGENFRLATAKKAQRRTGYAPTAKTTSDGDDDPKN